MSTKTRISAHEFNIKLAGFIGSENLYRYRLGGPEFMLTDGVKFMGDEGGLFWFIDIIATRQHQSNKDDSDDWAFQNWILTVYQDKSWIVVCDDGNRNVLYTQSGKFTDVDVHRMRFKIWVKNNVAYLPSER